MLNSLKKQNRNLWACVRGILTKKNKIKFILLIFLAGFFGFCFPFQTQAYLAPGIFVTDLKINEINGQEIKGEFTVWNSEKYYLSDLNYEIKLFQGTEFEKLQLINLKVPKETFFIPPDEKTVKSFSFQYPENIISGDYTLRAQIITERGDELGWKDEIISLKGGNKFLEIIPSSSRVLINEKEFFPLEGANIDPKEKVIAFLKIKNPGDEIAVIPQIKIFKRQFNMPLAEEYQDSPITFAEGETKEIKLEMPEFDAPESYLAEIKFYNDQKQVSGTQYFRWVVKGEGGKLLYIKADKDYYRAGESINLTIESIGPADFSDLNEGKLEVTIYGKNGNIVAKTSKNVLLNSDLTSSVISIPVKNDLISPKIEVKLIKDEKTLDERTINLPIFSAQAQQIKKNEDFNKYLVYLISATSLIIILIAGFLIYKFRIYPVKKYKK